MSRQELDITGRRYGRLVAIKRSGTKHGKAVWLCRCDCGAKAEVKTQLLNAGNTRSCGCLRIEAGRARGKQARTHGDTVGGKMSVEYQVWVSIVQRCTNQNNVNWVKYGGRGITVCDRWRLNYAAFLEDMGRRPPGRPHQWSVERKDNGRGYEPSNCVWATAKTQLRNTRQNYLLTVDGRTATLAEWLEDPRVTVTRSAVVHRINVGYDHKDALFKPARRGRHR